MRCEQCGFFHTYPPAERPRCIVTSVDGIRGGGECRRRPPVLALHDVLARFPVVPCDGWCGECEGAS